MRCCNIFILIFSYFYLASPCGITTHTEIAHRAATNFEHYLDGVISVSNLIKKYQSAFQAGNPYPDSFFPSICKKGVFHYVSEDTHWVPFINATINYINKTYKKPYNEDALRLITFLLGFTSHQIADVNWHSLDVEQGFLSAMGFVNFHGSFPDAHLIGDTGSDVINQFELNTKYIADLGDWFIPYKDLYNIYLDYYGKEIVTEADIIECSSILFLGRLGEQLAIALIYTGVSLKSPFITNKINDYFLGGMDDMATWTQISWKKVLYMLEYGLDKCDLQNNILYVSCDNGTKIDKELSTHRYHLHKTSINEKYVLDKSFAKFTNKDNGIYFESSEKFKNELKRSLKTHSVITEEQPSKALTSNSSYFILNDYATLGWNMASGDVNSDKNEDLIVGAPVYSDQNAYQNGRVFVIYSKNGALPMSNLNLETYADLIITPPDIQANSSRFGHSVVILDLNQDGFSDIVISAPSYNLGKIKYQGQVYVYNGNAAGDYSRPSIILTCENYQYCNLGWSMTRGDVNGDQIDDLIIGTPYSSTCGPQCGFVGVLFSKSKEYPNVIPVTNLDWIIHGNMIYEWFGFSMNAKLGYLAIGAINSRICALKNCSISDQDIQAVGRVYLYKYPSSQPVKVFEGKENFEQFGYDLDLSVQLKNKRSVISISSYTKDCKLDKEGALELNQGGVVQVYDISDINNSTLLTLLKSDRAYAGFGSVVKFQDVTNDGFDDLLIGAQLRTDSIVPVGLVEQGGFYVFNGGNSFPTGNFTDDCSFNDITPCLAQKATFVLQNNENQSRFGHSAVVVKNSKGNIQVVISAARSDNNDSRLSGKLKIFNL